ncbi:hypothetical protein [Bradyrhizobium sp. 930_D9_N1_4]|uniref:hypothetical protein n=1 Tax=Bradyrhizobium sp. 930_D9_N1_4 TaxID=3240374 RepID=UPI003F8B4DBC
MSIIDNTLAAQVPQFDPATPLKQAAQLQAADTENRQAQFKQAQLELGTEARGLAAVQNSPEFPQRWAEAADRMHAKGLLDDRAYSQWRNTPSPLLLKQMIAQTEDPTLSFRKQEAVREQGNTDRSFALQKTNADRNYLLAKQRADQADDPTPDGFEKNPDFGKVEGATQYRPLSGGPQDPGYLQSAAAAKAKVPRILAPGEAVVDMASGKETYKNAGGAGLIDDDTANFAAEQILQGAKGVKTGYGRGAQGPENIAKIDAAVAKIAKERNISATEMVQRGIDLVGDTSRERTAATQEAKMSAAGIEAQGAIKLGQEASDAVSRTKWVPVNKALQAYQSNTSDPDLKRFGAANLTIINTYARAINPNGVGTVADKEHAREMLSTADGPEAYKAVLDQLNKEIDMAHTAPVKARAGFRSERASRVGGAKQEAKPQPADRFSQIMRENGGDKGAAYKKMQEEGY